MTTGAKQENWPQQTVALTGSIGTGKSTVAQLFEQLGAYVGSADEFARAAVAKGSAGLAEVVKTFGAGILQASGELDREKLGKIVFADTDKRKALEKITHPLIAKIAEESFSKAFAKGYPLYVYDCPLLFETGLNTKGFRKIVVVSADRELCITRIVKRDGFTRNEAEKRLDSQLPIAKKVKAADYVIENNGTIEELTDKVRELFAALAG